MPIYTLVMGVPWYISYLGRFSEVSWTKRQRLGNLVINALLPTSAKGNTDMWSTSLMMRIDRVLVHECRHLQLNV